MESLCKKEMAETKSQHVWVDFEALTLERSLGNRNDLAVALSRGLITCSIREQMLESLLQVPSAWSGLASRGPLIQGVGSRNWNHRHRIEQEGDQAQWAGPSFCHSFARSQQGRSKSLDRRRASELFSRWSSSIRHILSQRQSKQASQSGRSSGDGVFHHARTQLESMHSHFLGSRFISYSQVLDGDPEKVCRKFPSGETSTHNPGVHHDRIA